MNHAGSGADTRKAADGPLAAPSARPAHDKPRPPFSYQTVFVILSPHGPRAFSTKHERGARGSRNSTNVLDMFVRPTRQATALCPNDARRAIVHRNELNEQQRPGDLVLFAQNFLETRGNKAVTRWIPKLIRRLTLEGDGADASAILADGLLFYTGAYIRQNSLDKFSLIPEALLCKDVLFITNHIDVSPVRGHSSSMAGSPVRAGVISTGATQPTLEPMSDSLGPVAATIDCAASRARRPHL